MKIRPVGAEMFHADRRAEGRTDRHDEANSRFRNFANAPYPRPQISDKTDFLETQLQGFYKHVRC
jgi:hypothetical protein